MFLMYVDESGDTGLVNSPTRYFVLSGVVIHELIWREYLEVLIAFRRRMRLTFGLKLREEIHAAHFINRPGALVRIPRNNRLSIIRHFADEAANLRDINIINVVVDKAGKSAGYDVIEQAWRALVQRFSKTMSHRNFRGPANADERGLILPDMSEVKRITQTIRRMRRFNPIPNQPTFGPGYRNLLVENLVEDPFFKDSRHSYFLQVADLAAFLLYQRLAPSAYSRKKGVPAYFSRLRPVLCTVASSSDPDGIVRL
jgi:hypothetical protein